jgi:DNA-binding NarL/FixJ family response regulator
MDSDHTIRNSLSEAPSRVTQDKRMGESNLDPGHNPETEGDLTRAAALAETALSQHAAKGDRMATLVTLTTAAQILAASARAEAATLLGAADTMRDEAGPSVWVVARLAYERVARLTRAFLTSPDFDAAVTAGQLLGTEQAVAAARAALATIGDGPLPSAPPGDALSRSLTPREQEVIRLVAAGYTDLEVATTLGSQVRTVNTHVANVRRDLGVTSRAAAAVEATRLGPT